MATIDELMSSPEDKVSIDDIRCAFNKHLRDQIPTIDIHDWEKQIPHLVSWIEKAAAKGRLAIVVYLQKRFLLERPADLITDRSHYKNYKGTFHVSIYRPDKTHPNYQLKTAFIEAARHGHLEIVEKLWAEAKWNHISLEDVQALVLKGNLTERVSNFLFSIALALKNSEHKKSATEPAMIEETPLQKAIKQLRSLKTSYGHDAVKLNAEMISVVQTLNNPHDVIKLHKEIEKGLVDRIQSTLVGDTNVIISKIAKQRILELVFLSYDSKSPMQYNQSISTFLNTSHRTMFGSLLFPRPFMGTTQSKDIYDKLYLEEKPLVAKILYEKENIKLQEMREDLCIRVAYSC